MGRCAFGGLSLALATHAAVNAVLCSVLSGHAFHVFWLPTWKWNCRVPWEFHVYHFEDPPNSFSKQLYRFTFLPAVYEGPISACTHRLSVVSFLFQPLPFVGNDISLCKTEAKNETGNGKPGFFSPNVATCWATGGTRSHWLDRFQGHYKSYFFLQKTEF